MKSIRSLFFLLNSFLLIGQVANAETQLDSVREILMPQYQYEKLSMDLPATSILMEKNATLWITGKKAVWRWQLTTNRLQKIEIIKDKNTTETLKHLAVFANSLFISSNRSLFQVKFSPLSIRRLSIAFDTGKAYSLGFRKEKDQLIWLHSHAIYAFHRNQLKPSKSSFQTPLGKNTKFAFDFSSNTLWFQQGSRLMTTKFSRGSTETKEIAKTNHNLRGVKKAKSDFFAHTKYAVLRYNSSGELVQTVPVEGNLKLISIDISDSNHSYLFHNKLLEVYKLKEKTSLRFKIPFGRVKKAGQMFVDQSYFVIVVDGSPRVFQLEGQW